MYQTGFFNMDLYSRYIQERIANPKMKDSFQEWKVKNGLASPERQKQNNGGYIVNKPTNIGNRKPATPINLKREQFLREQAQKKEVRKQVLIERARELSRKNLEKTIANIEANFLKY